VAAGRVKVVVLVVVSRVELFHCTGREAALDTVGFKQISPLPTCSGPLPSVVNQVNRPGTPSHLLSEWLQQFKYYRCRIGL